MPALSDIINTLVHLEYLTDKQVDFMLLLGLL
jgi:hypothetical protein